MDIKVNDIKASSQIQSVKTQQVQMIVSSLH